MSMQTPPSPRTIAPPMPSFMTVFDEEATRRELEELQGQHASEVQKPFPSNNTATTSETSLAHMNPHFTSFHKQRDSVSTSASESSESSPTTTVSTLDSSSMTEPSPGPSPETPAGASLPMTYALAEPKFQPPMRSQMEPTNQHFFEMQRPTTPAKKARNLKNLAVNTTSAYNLGRSILSAPFVSASAQKPIERTSAPNSPVFVKPPTPPRRKLGGGLNLTIKTPASNNIGVGGVVPPTPSIAKPNTLRHFQSSPSLPLLTSSHGPLGGMTLPQLRTKPAPRGFADIPIEDEEEDAEQNFDVPQSQEEKPESYPNGPIRIYEDGIDLYYEPSVEVASRYDVIFNVASEVKNPFTVAAEATQSSAVAEPAQHMGGSIDGSESASSPDTPKANPLPSQLPAPPLPTKMPEYIHIPWEHNTDLVPDLHRLVKVIDEKVKQGKRVLVHCQCGVSRSATLIVAYGIYKNPGITVQEAYDAVKKRSKWIGPNMNLIMQLQEFRSGLLRNSRANQLFNMPRKLSSTLSSTSTTDSFNESSKSMSGPTTPRTAPLPPEKDEGAHSRARTASMGPMSAAPLEPNQCSFWNTAFRRSWGEGHTTSDIDMKRVSVVSDTPYVDPKGHIVPMVHVIEQDDESHGIEQEKQAPTHIDPNLAASTKSQKRKTPNFSRQLPLRQDRDGDSTMVDAPAPPPLLNVTSPRSEEFGMIGLPKRSDIQHHDSFGLFSPMRTEFPDVPAAVLSQTAPTTVQPFPSLADAPAASAQTKPSVTTENTGFSGFSFFERQRTPTEPFSIMSPTSSSFPRDFPLRSENSTQTTDSSRLTPRKNPPRALNTKFSSPNLHERRRLQKLQNELDPKKHMDDLDALMSPRATQFTSNPFHELLTVKTGDTPVEALEKAPVTPTPSDSDPRSPAQLGISPITRNIFDVL
ncbi:uncharacterized protein PV09_07256 [Verruconis gallopava]|uniref:protein-tyrosine-phosphatase n=1 Tax=Verruconis gallopava TaxID=253628 RepID=A0A0D2APW5_9PEZI|nr:uncharacterized protein PV09_07256 [Verruconis gallopava]KIW01209.1 hypothetical protein PV09_07256 [Verruconis gallopava]